MAEQFGKRLSRLRENKKMTLKQVANAIGVPASTYRDWEVSREFNVPAILKLSQIFEVSIFELLTGQKPNHTEVLDHILNMEEQIIKLKILLRET